MNMSAQLSLEGTYDIFAGDVISNMEVRDVDMFCTCVELVIMRIRYGGLVVAKDFDCTGRGES